MPGIVDAHGHVMALGFRALTLDLSKASSLADAQAMIAAYAQANPARRWIIGAGWNQERSEEHTSELQSLMRITFAAFCLIKKKHRTHIQNNDTRVCSIHHLRTNTTH